MQVTHCDALTIPEQGTVSGVCGPCLAARVVVKFSWHRGSDGKWVRLSSYRDGLPESSLENRLAPRNQDREGDGSPAQRGE